MTVSVVNGLLFVSATVSSLSLPYLQLLNNELQDGSHNISGSGLVSLSNGAISSSNSSSLGVPFTECSAAKFGSPLNPPSCREAIEKVKWNDTQLAFRSRVDHESFDVGLPYRTLSSDGKCSVQLFFVAPAAVAHASLTEIRLAGQAIYDACATHMATGGYASRIGSDKNLNVVLYVTSYPNIICLGQDPPPLESCTTIANAISATSNAQTFGPDRQVPLPWSKASADGQCEMSIDISETTIDVFSWFGVWEQVTAIIEMCVALGKMGRSIANGELGSLLIEVDKGTQPQGT